MSGGRFRLPDRLPPVSDRAFALLRPGWWLFLLFALGMQVASVAYVAYEVLSIQPQFDRLGLDTDIDDDGSVALSAAPRLAARPPVVAGSKVEAVGGRPLTQPAREWTIAARLRAAPGEVVRLRLRDPHGRHYERALRRSDDLVAAVRASNPLSRRMRLAIRFGATLLGGGVLLVSAVLLFMRRARDPVALLLSFTFLTMLASVDPPLVLWLHTGLHRIEDFLATGWWLLLVLAVAMFPDGRFEPRWMRWMLVAAPIAAIPLFLDSAGQLFDLAVAVGFLVVALGAQAVRYRKIGLGIERQQLKWAALGFAAGIFALGGSLFLANAVDRATLTDPATQALYFLTTAVLFSLSFALIPLGLLVALLRFRLWEADRAIRRSIGVAGVTALIGLVWAASADLMKELVTWALGSQNQALATALGALIAVGVFAPSQVWVTRWLERRHAARRSQIARLPARLELWRDTEPPVEIGMRTLAAVAGELRVARAALLALTPTGHALIAARGIEAPERLATAPAPGDGFALALPVADDDGEVATLLLGERMDGLAHAEEDRTALAALLPALGEALRTSRRRMEHQEGMLRMIGAVEARLAKLEGEGEAQPA